MTTIRIIFGVVVIMAFLVYAAGLTLVALACAFLQRQRIVQAAVVTGTSPLAVILLVALLWPLMLIRAVKARD